jgi:hypothetical protein
MTMTLAKPATPNQFGKRPIDVNCPGRDSKSGQQNLLGHSNIKMTDRYADLVRAHIVKTGSVSREIWSKLEPQSERRESVEAGQKKIGHSA